MGDTFEFKGTTTFISKPKDTVIQNFQNQYAVGQDQNKADFNQELAKLLKLVLESKDLEVAKKEEVAHTLHSTAELVKDDKASKLALTGILQAIKDIVVKASDIAIPAIAIISKVMGFLH